MDGFLLFKTLKLQNPRSKIIIYTSFNYMESAIKAVEQGAFSYTRKAGEFGDLVNLLYQALLAWYRDYLEQEQIKSQRIETVEFLTNGVIHDFNNILQEIIGSLSLLRTGKGMSRKKCKILDQIEETLGQARNLTGKLFSFTNVGDIAEG